MASLSLRSGLASLACLVFFFAWSASVFGILVLYPPNLVLLLAFFADWLNWIGRCPPCTVGVAFIAALLVTGGAGLATGVQVLRSEKLGRGPAMWGVVLSVPALAMGLLALAAMLVGLLALLASTRGLL